MRARDLRSAALISGLSVLNIVVGFGFQALLASRLGTGPLADVFAAGVSVPTVIATAALGAGPIVLIPAFAHQRANESGALSLRGLRGLALLGLLVSTTLVPAAPVVAHAVAPGFGDAQTGALIDFLRVVAAVPVLAVLAAIGQAFAFTSRRFGVAGASAAVNGVCLLSATALASSRGDLSTSALAWAVVAGYAGQVLWVLPATLAATRVLRHGCLRRQESPYRLVGVFAFMAVTSLLYKSQPIIERLVGSTVTEGLPAALAYAGRFTQGLVMLASFGISLVAMPQLADALAARDTGLAHRIISVSLSVTLASTLCVVSFALAAYQAMPQLVLARGEFTDADAHLTATLLLASLPGVVFGAMAGPLVNVFYSVRRQSFVAAAGMAATVLGGVLSLAAAQTWHGPGITLGTSVGFGVSFAIFGAKLAQVVPGWSWARFGRDSGPLFAGGAAAAALGWVGANSLPYLDSALAELVLLAGELVAAVAVVLGLALALRWRLGSQWLRSRAARR